MIHRFYLLCTAITLIAATAPDCFAQTITPLQNMTFGLGVVRNNNAQHFVTVEPDGDFTHSSDIILINDPQEGIYELTGADALSAITVTATLNQNILGPGQDFTLDNFNIDAPTSTDVNGEVVVNVGARMRTSGTSIDYNPSSSFTGSFVLTITY